MGIMYVAAAFGVVPALLGAFHWLSRPPEVTSQPAPSAGAAEGSVADEAEEWLRSQSR